MPVQSCVEHRILPDALVIANADVVTPEEVIKGASVTIGNGIIEQIGTTRVPAGSRVVDATGLMLLPGFVDIHSDAVETAIQPRPGGFFPTEMAVRELDRTLVAYGITTIFHSLSFSDIVQTDLRNSLQCARLIREINSLSPTLKANTRIHLRFEVTSLQSAPYVKELIEENQIRFFSLMDHTPGQGQFVDLEEFRRYYGQVRGISAEELDRLIERRIAARNTVDASPIRQLTDLCLEANIRVASHDDDTPAKVARNHSLGVSLSEFPVNLDAAAAARHHGMHVSLGAPNILRGGSATGNLNARDAISEGFCTVICSDYAPVSMIHAGFALVREGLLDLVEMGRMLSSHPAEVVGLDKTTGGIEEGKTADLVLADVSGDLPVIQRTFVSGRQVYAGC